MTDFETVTGYAANLLLDNDTPRKKNRGLIHQQIVNHEKSDDGLDLNEHLNVALFDDLAALGNVNGAGSAGSDAVSATATGTGASTGFSTPFGGPAAGNGFWGGSSSNSATNSAGNSAGNSASSSRAPSRAAGMVPSPPDGTGYLSIDTPDFGAIEIPGFSDYSFRQKSSTSTPAAATPRAGQSATAKDAVMDFQQQDGGHGHSVLTPPREDMLVNGGGRDFDDDEWTGSADASASASAMTSALTSGTTTAAASAAASPLSTARPLPKAKPAPTPAGSGVVMGTGAVGGTRPPSYFTDFDPADWDDSSRLRHQLFINEMPIKSRVETQIKVALALYPPPKASHVYLPADTISKPKLQLQERFDTNPDVLSLDTIVVCHSDRYHYVNMCNGCIRRERKRAARKKVKLPAEEAHWTEDTEKRAVVFNCRQMVDLGDVEQVDIGGGRRVPGKVLHLPMRLACYCRHHSEKLGFRVYFVLKDHRGTVIARGMTATPVVITDDHKAAPPPPSTSKFIDGRSGGPVNVLETSADVSADVSRAGSPSSSDGSGSFTSDSQANPRKRKQSSSDDEPAVATPAVGGSGAITATASAPASSKTQRHRSRDSVSSRPRLPNGSPVTTANHSPYASMSEPSTTATSPQSEVDGVFSRRASAQSFTSNTIAPGVVTMAKNNAMSIMTQQQLPVPQQQQQQQQQQAQPTTDTDFLSGLTQHTSFGGPIPIIQRVIPGAGSIRGGIEVTILGQGFVQGLVVKFGDTPSIATHCWNSSTIVTHLPPAQVPGPVKVVFEGWASPDSKYFRYYDDTDRQLIELALQVVGLKMNGRIEDAREIAKRIISSSNGRIPPALYRQLDGQGGSGGNNASIGMSRTQLDANLTACIDLIFSHGVQKVSSWELATREGQTMLHLACILGLPRFVAALTEAGADVDAQDKNGYTPLHFAALHEHYDVVQTLLDDGADAGLPAADGMTPLDIGGELVKDLILRDYSGFEDDDMSSDDDSESFDSAVTSSRRPSRRGTITNRSRGGLDRYLAWAGLPSYGQRDEHGASSSHQQPFWNYLLPQRLLHGTEPSSSNDHHPHQTSHDTAPPSYEEIFPSGSNTVEDYSGAVLDDDDKQPEEKQRHSAETTPQPEEEDPRSEEELMTEWIQRRIQTTNDTMLFFFWLPLFVLLLVFLSFKAVAYIDEMDTTSLRESAVGILSWLAGVRRATAAYTPAVRQAPTPQLFAQPQPVA